MTKKNKIGKGGQGSVFKAVFHGEKVAMKCVFAGKITKKTSITQSVTVKDKTSDKMIQKLPKVN